jgi:cysteinyl-tRNA synthetase
MHNGLTRLNTKKISGSDAATAEGAAALATVRVKKLLDEHGGDLLRYLLLSTHYRRPIEFTPEAVTAAKKGFSTFTLLFERIGRVCPATAEKTPNMEAISAEMLESSNEHFVRNVLNLKMKFLEMMDDDFNTAGAIGVMHELAGAINSFIEKTGGESSKPPDVTQVIAAAGQTLRGLGNLLGMFRQPGAATGAVSDRAKVAEKQLADQLMDLIIQLRATAREKKDFATADAIRDGLAKLKITLEDRAGGTGWRKN